MNEQQTQAFTFYKEALELLNESGIDFLLGGAFATFHYTGIYRETKDLDIFCRSTDYPNVLKFFSSRGYRIELTDARWLAKVFKDDHFMDVIFDSVNHICTVDDSWFAFAHEGEIQGTTVRIVPPEEIIWCKHYVQNRERFDGADINHLILRCGKQLDWQRILKRLDQHWHLLLSKILIFQFVYPSDYTDIIPRWLFDELVRRATAQYDLPASLEKVCLGPLIDNTQYSIDIKEWNYKTYTIKSV